MTILPQHLLTLQRHLQHIAAVCGGKFPPEEVQFICAGLAERYSRLSKAKLTEADVRTVAAELGLLPERAPEVRLPHRGARDHRARNEVQQLFRNRRLTETEDDRLAEALE